MDQKDDRPIGQRFDEKKAELTKDAEDAGSKAKEDIKGAARRVEGNLRNDEGLKREHDESMLEKAGESIKDAAHYVGEKFQEGAKKIGLTKDE